ncbi:hypothetical protein [Planomicrobium okeanokoites]|uniref:hypothetical protein n=1 Tax=Planomicrobium okeanokoites TaxID=244 RepID=UPI000A015E42|nr:hypothetical protein [Planomicrobium okeanokoites]
MLKKILIGAALMVLGFIMKDIRNSEGMVLENILIYGGIALAVIAFKEWVEVPYDWDKDKNKDKDKEKKNLG